MRQVGGRWRWAHGWLVGCEGDGGGHMVGWLAELTGASTSYWKPWAPISLTLSLYIYIYIGFNICINRKQKGTEFNTILLYITFVNQRLGRTRCSGNYNSLTSPSYTPSSPTYNTTHALHLLSRYSPTSRSCRQSPRSP
jgi:hypothetical protein